MIYGQPVISRETRRLLITIVVSIGALWVLARIRFQERPTPSTAVPTVLAQLRPAVGYADLARMVADIRPGISAAITTSAGGAPALRIRSDAGVALGPGPGNTRLAYDRATGLAIVRQEKDDVPGVMPWAPRLLDYPRYLIAADVQAGHVTLRPVFIGALFQVPSALWSGDLWALPPSTSIAPGTFVFTTDGALAGLAVSHENRPALVPAALLLDAVARLQQQTAEPGELGITIQPLTSAIASATGAETGVVVSAIDPIGVAAGHVVATDVIEAVNGQTMESVDHWRAAAARVSVGQTLTLRVRRGGEVRDVSITARSMPAAAEPAADAPLGLRLRTMPKTGAHVLSVEPESRAARAGLREGDVITVVGGRSSPTPAEVTRAFATLPQGGSLAAAVTRGSEHLVIAIQK